jgi:TfoX/Sxy family transcriptional regulator of competence genes
MAAADIPVSEKPPSTITIMAYDEDLAYRIRELVGAERGVVEKRMFGGLAFLVGGNMAIAASGKGGVLVRVPPEEFDQLVDSTKADVAVMGGRPMSGWVRVASEDVATKRQLTKWVKLGIGYAGGLPAKTKR